MSEDKTQEKRDNQASIRGLPFTNKILNNAIKQNDQRFLMENAFNYSFADKNKKIDNNKINNSNCNYSSAETKFLSKKSTTVSNNDRKDFNAISSENNKEQKKPIPSIFNNISTLSFNKNRDNHNTIQEKDFKHMETRKIQNQKRNESNAAPNYTNNFNNNSSALDSKFVTIDTSSAEKNYNIHSSCLSSKKKISQSNKKEFSRLNRTNSNNNSRGNSKERSKEKASVNTYSNSKAKSKKDNLNVKHLDEQGLKNIGTNSKIDKKEVPIHDFTFKVNNSNNNRENFETVKIKKKVFSPENVSFEANNFTSKNVLKESGNKRDLGKITFSSNFKLNQDSKILPDVPLKDTKFKINSKLKNSSKDKLRDNSANSRISHSFSKEKRERSGCVGSSVGRRIDSKERNRDESFKRLNNNSHCGDDNHKKLKLIKNKKIQNLPMVNREYIAKKPFDHYQKSCSSKSKFTNDNRTTTLEHEDPSENLSNEKIVYLHTDVYNDRNPLEKSHKVNNKLNLKNLEGPNSSKLPTPNSSTITNNTNNSKNSKNLLYFKNININNLSNFLENFNANKSNNKRPSQDEAKITTQKTFETTSTNKILSSNDNNLSSSRNLNQKDLDYSISNIASSVPTESNLGNDKSPNCHNPKGNCDTSDSGLLPILKPESIKKFKESFKSNEVCTNNVAVENNKVPNDHIESYFNQGKSKLETKSKIKINNVNYSFNNTSLLKSNEKNKLTRILTYDNADSQSNKLKLKLNTFENHNSNATLKEHVSLNRDAARGSRNNSVNKNREKTKSNSRSKYNEKNDLENNNLRTPIFSKENLKKLAKIKLQGDEITNNSGFHSTSKKINDKNFCTLLANSTLNCSTAKANKSQNLCKIPILKNSSSKKNLACNNAKRDLIPNEKADNLKNRRENKDVFCESKISKNSSKDKNRTNNAYNKISSKNNASSYDKKNDDDDDDDKNKRRNSFEKTIHINHNFNHNINHNILINIENPDAVKTENLRDSLKKFYPAVASKKSKNEDPRKAAGKMTSKIRDYSDLNLINDQEYSEINIEYLHTDNPSIFGSENKFKKFMHTIETAKDNYMNLKNFNQVSSIFNNKTNKEQDNLDSRGSGKLDLEYLCAAKQNLSTSNNKNLNAFNSNCSSNKNNPSSSKNIGEMTNICNNSVAYKNTGSHNKIFNNEIATKVSNPFLSKNSIKLNIDKNLNNNLNDVKINSENNSALSVSNNNTIISHKNNLIVNNKLNYYNSYNNNNNIKLDQSMKKSPNTSENVCNTISSNLIIESLKKNLLVKKPINKINNNNSNNYNNKDEKKNEFYNSKDSVEQTDFSRGVVHTEPTQKINEKEFIDNLKSNFLDKNKKLKNLNLKEINNYPSKNINEGFNNKKLETINNNNKIFTNLRGGSPLEALKSIANLDKNFDLTLSLKPKFLNSNNENVSLTLKGNFATISHDKERENFNSKNNANSSNEKINNIPFEPKDYKYSSNEKLNIFNIPKKLDLVKNKPSLFETLNIKKSSKQKLSNASNNIMTDEDSNVDGNSKISKKNSKTKLNSQSFKYSSSSKSKSHSNSQNKETLPKEKDLLEETISYIISDDEPSTRRNKNNTIFNTEESETQNVFQKSVHKINNSNDEVDFEKFYAEMNWKLMNNPSSSSNYK